MAARGRGRRAGPLRHRRHRPGRRCEVAPPRSAGLAGAQHAGHRSFVSSAGTSRLGCGTAGAGARRLLTPRPRVDALLGLAADALGVGRFAASARHCSSAPGAVLDVSSAPARLPVRCAVGGRRSSRWPAAMAAAAVGACRTCGRAGASGDRSVRHQRQIATWCSPRRCAARAGRAASRRVADAALDAAARFGLIPLRWALASLLGDIGSDAARARKRPSRFATSAAGLSCAARGAFGSR